MLVQIIGGKSVEVDEKTAEILINAGKAVSLEPVKELIAEKKTRKKVNND